MTLILTIIDFITKAVNALPELEADAKAAYEALQQFMAAEDATPEEMAAAAERWQRQLVDPLASQGPDESSPDDTRKFPGDPTGLAAAIAYAQQFPGYSVYQEPDGTYQIGQTSVGPVSASSAGVKVWPTP
jgi:hypothetical protein